MTDTETKDNDASTDGSGTKLSGLLSHDIATMVMFLNRTGLVLSVISLLSQGFIVSASVMHAVYELLQLLRYAYHRHHH